MVEQAKEAAGEAVGASISAAGQSMQDDLKERKNNENVDIA